MKKRYSKRHRLNLTCRLCDLGLHWLNNLTVLPILQNNLHFKITYTQCYTLTSTLIVGFYNKEPVFVSYGWCNKLLQISCLKTPQIDSLMVLEERIQKWDSLGWSQGVRCLRAGCSLRWLWGRILFQFLDPRSSQSLKVSSIVFKSLCFCYITFSSAAVSLFCLPHIRMLMITFRVHLDNSG